MPGVTGDEVTKDFRIDGAARFQNLNHLCFGAIDKADILSGKIGERTDGGTDRTATHRQSVHQNTRTGDASRQIRKQHKTAGADKAGKLLKISGPVLKTNVDR